MHARKHMHTHSYINDLSTHTYTDAYTLVHANIYLQSIHDVFHEHTHVIMLRKTQKYSQKHELLHMFVLIHACA